VLATAALFRVPSHMSLECFGQSWVTRHTAGMGTSSRPSPAPLTPVVSTRGKSAPLMVALYLCNGL